MVMLTGGQVSMAISSAIVFIFTFLLFLSGYVLQQQTVRGMQEAIKPRLPQPMPAASPVEEPLNPNARLARRLGHRDPKYENMIEEMQLDWKRLGHVQLVTDHRQVCTAVMLFADLHRDKSPAARILLFPRSWIEDTDEEVDPYLETSRRLLRAAVRRYKVILRPIDPVINDYISPTYSLASIFSLIDFDRLLYLAPSGVIIDSLALDALLAFSPSRKLAALPDDPTASRISTNFMLIQPSSSTFRELVSTRGNRDVDDKALFQRFFEPSSSLLPPTVEDDTTLYFESPELRTLDNPESFNSTQFLGSTAYVRLTDPEFPGPEYDIPYGEMVKLRPKEDDVRWVWEKLYFKFRGGRMDVCGLDLLLVPSKSKAAAAAEEPEMEAAGQEL